MSTSTEHHAPANDSNARERFGTRTALSVVVASIATFGVLYLVLTSGEEVQHVQSIPAQPNTAPQRVAAPVLPSPEPMSPAPAQPALAPPALAPPALAPPALAMDAQGYVDSARCDSGQRAVAVARTEHATMVVCEASDGTYEYQGIRLRDGAALELDDVRPMAAGFEARNDGTTYRLSPTELVVLSGESLQSRDPVLDYRAG
ncbi:hypothetical protein [Mycolicibacterium iranicum]|uniref:Serine/threonine protein kinase n=1 Tax=Mycolicibacterium iranicum TaxID=912594 RepID=A0A178M0Y8_MYCIR|nr:hypothetical protein [Mycolicibacterium iranicum]OAN41555.1 hypothetical protein A4X20_13225 [Mycolicibacterium iranicum]